MKKLLIAIALVVSVSSYAQVQVGIKGGLNASNFWGKNLDGYKKEGLMGFHIGGYLDVPVTGIFSVKPEVLFSTQGAKLENSGTSTDYKLSYVTVPVLGKFNFGGIYLEAGPQFGFKTSEDIGNSTINNFAKDLDLSAAAGIGFSSASGFGLAARYIAGLSKVSDYDFGTTQPDYKNSVIQVSLTYALLGRR